MSRLLWWPLQGALIILLFAFLWRVIASSTWTFGTDRRGAQAYVLTLPCPQTMTPPQVLALARKASVGRALGNDLILDDQSVAGIHARIYLNGGEYWLEDLCSQNRTYVNGELVTAPRKLEPAAAIKLGNAVLVFHRPPNSHAGEG